ncbi:microsomal signal peptidase 12 kDa subunit [Leucogyrophana mollusca]|uniref:Microsomal signal peptidase 12 kDa subunit n=1 Tax=Leucogyrophana mollusca TaxID=85980 RepID=A0ACB8B478_9AGAM|nr:microsomal signal peptidase 12 kDa subunit [Leucogyrophana mollusca]
MTYLQDLVEGKIDFHGQKIADTITRVVLIASSVIAFILGFAMRSLSVTFTIFGVSTLAVCLLVLPPWPIYNQHPVKWLPVQEDSSSKQTH